MKLPTMLPLRFGTRYRFDLAKAPQLPQERVDFALQKISKDFGTSVDVRYERINYQRRLFDNQGQEVQVDQMEPKHWANVDIYTPRTQPKPVNQLPELHEIDIYSTKPPTTPDAAFERVLEEAKVEYQKF